MRVLVVVTSIAIQFSACQDLASPRIPPETPVLAIVDGRRGGGWPGFYFLPPIVEDLPTPRDEFDSTFLPYLWVDVCVLEGTECGELINWFTSNPIPGVDRHGRTHLDAIHIGTKQKFSFYRANLLTDQFDLDPTPMLRARVQVFPASGFPVTDLGHADIDLVETWKELKEVDRHHFVALLKDRLLPIAFRIEGKTPVQSKQLLNYCTASSDITACASVRLRTLAVQPGDPRARFPDTRTIIGFDLRNLQGLHPADNTTGSLIAQLAFRVKLPPAGGAVRASSDASGGFPSDGDVGVVVAGPGCFDDDGNVLFSCAGQAWVIEPFTVEDADGITLIPDWGDVPSAVRGCDSDLTHAGFALITCERDGFDGWVSYQIFEASYELALDDVALQFLRFAVARNAPVPVVCEPEINCYSTPIRK